MARTITVDGILFDNDGVLVDSVGPAMHAWRVWAKTWAPDVDPSVDFPHGVPAREIVARLVAPADVERAFAEVDAAELALVDETAAIPGAVDLTRSLPEGRWAVVTSAGRRLAVGRLQSAGHEPDLMVTVDDVTNGKPDPEPYRRGAELLGIPPERLVVLEDAAAGVEAARAAGIGFVIGVGSHLDAGLVDALVPDLTHVRCVGTDGAIMLAVDA